MSGLKTALSQVQVQRKLCPNNSNLNNSKWVGGIMPEMSSSLENS
jgi:hypothetical protein